MESGEIIADGPTQNVLNNNFLTERSSLILPQTRQLSLALQEIGFQDINKVVSKNDITEYLIKFLRNKTTSAQEE